MSRYKYNVGDRLGPWNILFLERSDEIADSRGRKPYGFFECPGCGEKVKTRIRSVVQGHFHWCEKCRKKVRSERWKDNDLGKQNALNLVNQKFGSWTVVEKTKLRQNGHILWHCICDCGNEQDITTCNLTQGVSTQCVLCSQKSSHSKGVKKIIKILDDEKISYKMEHTFNDCKYKKLLRFDFYLPDYNCCIEYDGEQHFKESTFFREDLKEIQKRDNIKNEYCKQNDIKLIRIPYTDLKRISKDYLFSLIGGDSGDVVV